MCMCVVLCFTPPGVHAWCTCTYRLQCYDLHVFTSTGLPWGVVASLPRSIQTLAAQLGVDRKSLSIIDTTMRGTILRVIHVLLYTYMPMHVDNTASIVHAHITVHNV